MAETKFLADATGSTKRPDLVSVVGIFTFINTGLFGLLYLFALFGMMAVSKMPVDEFVQLIRDAMSSYPLPSEQTDAMEQMAVLFHASGVPLMLIYVVRTVARLVGAVGMWRGRKMGFYIYAAAQLVGLFAPHVILPWSMLGVFGPLMTVGITALYGSQLKRMS